MRSLDVRVVLLLAALALGALAGDVPAIVRMFLATFSNERFVVPICTAMGFAYVLRQTECDRHLVHLLVRPLTRVRPLLVPGTVAVGFVVNIPVVSQTSTAVTLGAVVLPILAAARIPALTVGAALLLGSSIGGELLNPGAPEFRTVVTESARAAEAAGQPPPGRTDAVRARVLPLDLTGLVVATGLFWLWSLRAGRGEPEPEAAPAPPEFRVQPLKAAIPMLPLVLLFLTGPPLNLVRVPEAWLVSHGGPVLTPEEQGLFDSRLIGAAMLIGVVVAGLATPRASPRVVATFFEGAGYGFTHIISLIVAANCFGEGVKVVGLAGLLGNFIRQAPALLLPAAGVLSLGFGVLCGSGMATTQSLFGFFTEPALELGIDPLLVGAVVALAAAAGRTMSPFAAVTLMCADMTRTDPWRLVARTAPPLLAAVAVEIALAMVMAAGP